MSHDRTINNHVILSPTKSRTVGNPAAPKDCLAAAEAAGAPEAVIKFLNNPTGDLSQAEKFIIRQFLNRSGLNDVCGDARDKLDANG